jgi:multiple sugar transport system ATP-binding protein
MAEVLLQNISKHYTKSVPVVDNLNLTIRDGEFLTMVGPSGCGKSTTLRMVAGLEDITAGELHIGGHLHNHVPAKDRGIAMVFQNYALFPHMTVTENISFGLRIKKYPKDEIAKRVDWAMKLMDLVGLEKRKPGRLSGGQRQRVALGRALVLEPQVLLLDEPLSNLDAILRSQMRTSLKRLHKQLGVTTIYVTHDQSEAMTLSDRIAVMNGGKLVQVGTPSDVYNNPVDTFVASFIGSPQINFFEGKITKDEAGHVTLDVPEFQLQLAESFWVKLAPHLGKEVLIGIRAQHIRLRDEFSRRTTDNIIPLTVDIIEPLGDHNIVVANIGYITVSFIANPDDPLSQNDHIETIFDGRKVLVFDKETKQALT